MSDLSEYRVGPGRPPLNTRFVKGKSGNPSGKPGPSKTAQAKLGRAVEGAMAMDSDMLREAVPKNALEEIAFGLVLDAAAGDRAALRTLLALMGSSAAAAPSLHQGETQGENRISHPPDENVQGSQAFSASGGEAAGSGAGTGG